MQKKKSVFVAMSGGVDSSVAALLLAREGYDVTGVFMQGWNNPRFDCQWKEDRQDAMRVAALLNIPFKTLDYSRDYYERVVSYLLSEYERGRTPNPDVMCNKEIKFGLFYQWAIEHGADFIATGHYAKTQLGQLHEAKDTNKDQTYFLWTLTPEILSHTLFPIGDYTKPEIRAIAKKAGLPTAVKKDSQGICFVGEGNMLDFLKDHIKEKKGTIQTASGKKVGEHAGIEFFTIGQRHGIGTPGGAGAPLYVAEKHAETQTLIVAEGDKDPILYKKEIGYHGSNWLEKIELPLACEARIRYRQPLSPCTVYVDKVIFESPQRAVASGQSVVFYKNNRVLGGGVID